MRPDGRLHPRIIKFCFRSRGHLNTFKPLAPSLLRELEQAFGAPVLEAYAMTENAHHISSHTLDRERRPGTVGSPCRTIS